ARCRTPYGAGGSPPMPRPRTSCSASGFTSRHHRPELDRVVFPDLDIVRQELRPPDDQDGLRIDPELGQQVAHPPAARHLDLALLVPDHDPHAPALTRQPRAV